MLGDKLLLPDDGSASSADDMTTMTLEDANISAVYISSQEREVAEWCHDRPGGLLHNRCALNHSLLHVYAYVHRRTCRTQ